MSKVLFVEYCADDVLGGTANMDAMTELAYRRILDLIYSTNDRLLDNDSLQYATKTGNKWKKIRKDLIEVFGKIYIEDGYIRNKRCSEKLQKSRNNIEQKKIAGKASAKTGKSLKNIQPPRTDVPEAVATDSRTNQEPKNPIEKEKNNKKKKKDFEEFWNLCPRKVGRIKAEEKYWIARRNESKELIHSMMETHAKEMKGKEAEFIPHPATWLHQGRYYDETQTTVIVQEKREWPEWKTKIAAILGDHIVKGWFNTAEKKGNTIYFERRFEYDQIKGRHIGELEKMGLEIELRQA